MSNSLGLHIPNSDYDFHAKKVKAVEDLIFVICSDNEILTYEREQDPCTKISILKRKFLLLSRMQDRNDVYDVFKMRMSYNLLDTNPDVILTVTGNLIIHYWNVNDGLCLSKVNLSSCKASDEKLIGVYQINKRFLIVIFSRKSFLYDSFSHLICKEESFTFGLKKIYQAKENKFFLLSEYYDTYFLEIANVYNVGDLDFNYEDVRYRLIKHTFHIDKFFNDETIHNTFSHQEFLIHNLNQKLKVSFLDSVEELTELACLETDGKYKIIFLDKIIINKEEYIIVIYKDLTSELFIYDKKIREIKRYKKLMIMIEEEFLSMNYVVCENSLIGWTEKALHLIDLSGVLNNNEEKYVDKTIELNNIFGESRKGISFTNYFRDNFQSYVLNALGSIGNAESKISSGMGRNILNQPTFKITASAILSHSENNSIYYILGTNTGKVAIVDVFFTEKFKVNPLILLDYHTAQIEIFSIYENRLLITSSSDGVITFTDISKQKLQSAINKIMMEEAEFAEGFNVETTKNIIRRSFNSGTIPKLFDDKLNTQKGYSYSMRKALSQKFIEDQIVISESLGQSKTISLLPSFTMKNFNKLRRIIPVIQLDHFMTIEDTSKRKCSLLAFELEDCSTTVINMDNLKSIYFFNQHSTKYHLRNVYHVTYEKCLIFYLDNDTVKICNYSTRTCDRFITDLDKIYTLLRVDEKLKVYFIDSDTVKNFVTEAKTKFDENLVTNKKQKKDDDEYYYSYQASFTERQQSYNNQQELTVENIIKCFANPRDREIFVIKYFQSVLGQSQRLRVTPHKFEAIWMKKLESVIIDDVIEIVNHPTLNDKLKKIKIMNLLYNPQNQSKIQERYENLLNGIEGTLIKMGNQLNEFIVINYPDFFVHIEKAIHDQKVGVAGKSLTYRNNYFNYLSLFHIWNFSLDQDMNIVNYFKIYQPILEFNLILLGIDSSCSIVLTEEPEVDGDFKDHFQFFTNYFSANKNGSKSTINKDEKFLNKKYLVNKQQGYLVNMKNYQISSSISHHMNLFMFGSLIAALGFKDSTELCKLINSEKILLRSLAQQSYIKFSNFSQVDKFMYENIDDLTLANKDLILVDYLAMEYSIVSSHSSLTMSTSSSVSAITTSLDNGMVLSGSKIQQDLASLNPVTMSTDMLNGNTCSQFSKHIQMIIDYLVKFNSYLFNVDDNDTYINFYKLNKEKNIEPSSKLIHLTEYELSLITFIMTFNFIAQERDKINEVHMIKITEIMVLYIFKILNDNALKITHSKAVVELISKSSDYLEKIYRENMTNYAKFLIELYTSLKIPIDLDGLFKKYEIGNYTIIKSENNFNFLKIMLAKLIKNFSKVKISFLLKIIVDDFKKRNNELDYFSYLLEVLWILFREKNAKYVQYLPTLINLIMTTMSPSNKELKTSCIENSKKVLSCLLPNYPMIAFHQNSQKLAVGANDGKIYIYDLTSGNVWKNLNAHTNEITALSFDFTGNILISYSSTESTVKFWKIGLTNFFSNFFSMKDGHYKQHKFVAIRSEISMDEKIAVVKFQLMPKNDNKIILIREDKNVEVLSL